MTIQSIHLSLRHPSIHHIGPFPPSPPVKICSSEIFRQQKSSEIFSRDIFIWNLSSKYVVEMFSSENVRRVFSSNILVEYSRQKYASNILVQIFSSDIFPKTNENVDILKFITDCANVDPESRNWNYLFSSSEKNTLTNIPNLKKSICFTPNLTRDIEREGLADRHG